MTQTFPNFQMIQRWMEVLVHLTPICLEIYKSQTLIKPIKVIQENRVEIPKLKDEIASA